MKNVKWPKLTGNVLAAVDQLDKTSDSYRRDVIEVLCGELEYRLYAVVDESRPLHPEPAKSILAKLINDLDLDRLAEHWATSIGLIE